MATFDAWLLRTAGADACPRTTARTLSHGATEFGTRRSTVIDVVIVE
jgi:hypothetical protein